METVTLKGRKVYRQKVDPKTVVGTTKYYYIKPAALRRNWVSEWDKVLADRKIAEEDYKRKESMRIAQNLTINGHQIRRRHDYDYDD